jgi:hypothetical protein
MTDLSYPALRDRLLASSRPRPRKPRCPKCNSNVVQTVKEKCRQQPHLFHGTLPHGSAITAKVS